jgi:hypothetical protein
MKERIGLPSECKSVLNNSCFLDAVSVDLFRSEPRLYLDALCLMAIIYDINLFNYGGYEEAMVMLMKSINCN